MCLHVIQLRIIPCLFMLFNQSKQNKNLHASKDHLSQQKHPKATIATISVNCQYYAVPRERRGVKPIELHIVHDECCLDVAYLCGILIKNIVEIVHSLWFADICIWFGHRHTPIHFVHFYHTRTARIDFIFVHRPYADHNANILNFTRVVVAAIANFTVVVDVVLRQQIIFFFLHGINRDAISKILLRFWLSVIWKWFYSPALLILWLITDIRW